MPNNNFFYTTMLSENSNDIEIIKTGKWNHPQYGELIITKEDIDLFIKSFNDNVRGIDIAIDLEHGITDKKNAAAGWIKSLKKIDNSLYATVEWTELGDEAIKSKQYKYFSPEFKYKYTDSETGKTYQNVLLGGGLTNRPFIKGMAPVLMSEDVIKDINNNIATYNSNKKEEAKMDKELLVALKLSETATQEEIDVAIAKQVNDAKKLSEDNEKLTTKVSTLEDDKTKADAENITLSEKIKTLEATKTDIEKENIKLSERITTVEKNLIEKEYDELAKVCLSEGKMTQPMVDKYKKLYLSDKETAIDLISSLQPIVKLTEEGSSSDGNENTSAIKLFEQEVQKAIKTTNLNYTDALAFVEKDKPDLFNACQKERSGR